MEIEASSEEKKGLLTLAEDWILELKKREDAYHFSQNGMDFMPVSKPFKLQWQGKNYNVFIKSKQECNDKLDQIQNQLTALDNEDTVRQIVDPPNTPQVNTSEHFNENFQRIDFAKLNKDFVATKKLEKSFSETLC